MITLTKLRKTDECDLSDKKNKDWGEQLHVVLPGSRQCELMPSYHMLCSSLYPWTMANATSVGVLSVTVNECLQKLDLKTCLSGAIIQGRVNRGPP